MRFSIVGSRDASSSSLCRVVITLLALVAIASPALAIEKASEQVSAFYGSFSHSIPIEVPGFRGLEPRFALSYSSEGRNGLVGVGWSLSGFSTIQRVNAGLGSPKFDVNDIYILDGQELVKCVAGSVSPSCTSGGNWSTKIESYQKIWFDSANNKWTVWSKDGTRTVYNATINVPPNALVVGGTLRWGVNKRIDTDNNEVNYSWDCVAADYECYPLQAVYNGYTVTFFTEARPDHLSWAAASALGRTSGRLRSVVVAAPAYGYIRGYMLTYQPQPSPLTGRSRLASVQHYGKDLTNTNGFISGPSFLPAQTFTYQDDPSSQGGRTFVDWAAPPTPPTTTEPVTWANLVWVGTAGDGSSLIKGAGGSGWNAGADSSRAISAGDGYVQWTASDPIVEGKAAGLSNGNTDASLADIDYAFVENGFGLHAYEKGIHKGSYTRVPGAALRIEVAGGIVYFKQDNIILRQSTTPPVYPLRVDASIHAVNDLIQSVSLSGQLIYVNSWCQAILMTGDFNGDGRTDQLCYSTTGGVGRSHVALATANGFTSPTLWLSGFALTRSVIADFNNDGRADLATHAWNGDFSVAVSNGTNAFAAPAFWGNATGTYQGGPLTACAGDQVRVGAGDFNGDGRTDVFCKRPNWESSYNFVGLAQFSGGNWSFNFSNVFGNFSCDTGEAQVGAIDFDGDGKDDWYCIGAQANNLQVYTSTGSTFHWPAFGSLSICAADGYVLGDFNGDGRTDAACRNNGKVALSMGRSFMEHGEYGGWCFGAYPFGADVDGDGATEIVCNNPGSGATDIQVRKWVGAGQTPSLAPAETWRASWCAGDVRSGDWNGDNKTDLYCTSTTTPAVAGTGGRLVDLASTFANGLGGTVALAYTPSSAFPNTNNPSTKHTITSLTIGDGRGWFATNTFTYSGGLMDRQERVFLGYRYAKKTLPCLTGESSCPYIENWFRQDLAAAGQPETVIRRHGGGNILSKQAFAYTTNGTTIPRTALLTGETTYSYDDIGCPSSPCGQEKQTTVTHQYDAYGNRTQSASGGDPADPLDNRTTNWLYAYNPSLYIVDTTSEERHLDDTGASVAATRYRYDGGAWGAPPSEGHPTLTERWLQEDPADPWVETTTVYSPVGNVTSVTNPTNVVTTTTYDTVHNIYPQTVMNPALPAEAETTTWDARCGLPSQHVDANGQLTTFQSDNLCRRTRTNMPLGGFEEIFYRDFGNPNIQRVVVETPPAVSGGGNLVTAEHFDGLGRKFMKVDKGPAPVPAQMIYTVKTFNPRGGLESETAPSYLGDPTYTTTRTYDALDRLTQVRHPDDETIDKSYGLWSETTFDQNGKPTTLHFDAYGRTVLKEQLLDGQSVQTTSTYDSLDRLVGLEGPLEATWTWLFDTLGRNVQKSDPDAGTWTYEFDAAGRMTLQTDAKQQRTVFTYVAGRLATKTTYATGSMNPEATVALTYSQARAGYFNSARLTTITGPGTTMLEKDYDALGRNVKERRLLDEVPYTMQTVYDAGGRLISKQFPDLETYQISYDPAGRPKGWSSVLTDALWDASGRLVSQTNVNNTVTQRTYSPTRGFLTSILTTAESVIQSLQYTPDPTGRLSSVTSPYTNESWTYDYDDLYRLEGATAVPSSAHNQTWTYDKAGRILNNSRVGWYSYNGAAHGPTTAGPNTYTRDLNGNVLTGAGRTFTWNAANRLTQVNSTYFVYDDAGERLKKTKDTNVSRYPFGDDYEITNGVTTKYFSLPGMGVIGKKVTNAGHSEVCNPNLARNGFYWTHTDHLGSIQAVTDSQSCEIKRRKYRAYGETLEESVPQHVESRGWIDQRLDTETGLTYLHARSYDSLLGVFASPDPSDPTHPGVGLNRFIYGLGNPLFGTDRSGLTFSYSCGGPHAGAIDDCLTFGMRAGPSVMYDPKTNKVEIYQRREGAPYGNSAQAENDFRAHPERYGPPDSTAPFRDTTNPVPEHDASRNGGVGYLFPPKGPNQTFMQRDRPTSGFLRDPRNGGTLPLPERGPGEFGYWVNPRKGHRPNAEDKQAQQHEPQ